MEKLIFKVAENIMGDFNYIGFRKWIGENPALGTDIYGNYILVKPDEYMIFGFSNKPDVANWKKEISKKEFESGGDGTLLGCGELAVIKLVLSTSPNIAPVEDTK